MAEPKTATLGELLYLRKQADNFGLTLEEAIARLDSAPLVEYVPLCDVAIVPQLHVVGDQAIMQLRGLEEWGLLLHGKAGSTGCNTSLEFKLGNGLWSPTFSFGTFTGRNAELIMTTCRDKGITKLMVGHWHCANTQQEMVLPEKGRTMIPVPSRTLFAFMRWGKCSHIAAHQPFFASM